MREVLHPDWPVHLPLVHVLDLCHLPDVGHPLDAVAGYKHYSGIVISGQSVSSPIAIIRLTEARATSFAR